MEKYIEKRPWGQFERFCLNQLCTVKMIFVLPGEELSLQRHNKRSEFWRVIRGGGEITVGEAVKKAEKGEEFFIEKKAKHRVKAGEKGIEILEISFGEFDEEDEERLEDKYKR
ncbi:phosphomannose isomerase type II C-terminal cupin domain [Patescibacteria group bacterium]|nr:phosphomannose isomerase type II C-terminal cupin domain [Patescibacteria group bacterium]MBU4082653.1 phosphomannose isomerase type II C-terminal cupin domain [Patescibacteria group bacterium]MCG2809586.1 phosphomannose isomerase type II C-terminal cupin domain [Candidatus Portnoybacteria bacterium]